MVDRESEARGRIASAPPKETPPPGLIRPAPVSGVEGSREGFSAGFIALLETTGYKVTLKTAAPRHGLDSRLSL